MVLAYAALAGLVIILSDALILALDSDSRRLRMLTEFGCDEGQRFFYGKPGPGERLIGSAQETSPTVRMGRVGPAYLPPVGAGGALMKETAHV
ncbi:MAG: hypothetical protein ACHQAU_00765 [Gammaproteobacteria bacterium]